MRDREAIISTYLGNGIALPHGTSEAQATILRTGLAVVQFPAGVPWGDEPARLVIGLAAHVRRAHRDPVAAGRHPRRRRAVRAARPLDRSRRRSIAS